MQNGISSVYKNATVFKLKILNDLRLNYVDLKLKLNQEAFCLHFIADDFVKFLHVCSIQTMKAEFETQRN